MTGSAENTLVRMFVALDLPKRIKNTLDVWRRCMPSEAFRFPDAPTLRETLAFLATRPLEEVDRIGLTIASVVEACAVPRLRLGTAVTLPGRRPRLVAVSLGDETGELRGLQTRTADGLEEGGFFERERRSFFPHVTIARLRNTTPARGALRKAPVAKRSQRGLAVPKVPLPKAKAKAEPLLGVRVSLYRSESISAGGRYRALWSYRLAT